MSEVESEADVKAEAAAECDMKAKADGNVVLPLAGREWSRAEFATTMC